MATEVKVPDIGAFENVPVIEVHLKAGDRVNEEDPLITLESDKATMDVPAPLSGRVADISVTIGDEVSTGSLILMIEPGDGAAGTPPSLVEQQEPGMTGPPPPARVPEALVAPRPDVQAAVPVQAEKARDPSGEARDLAAVHAGPSVRRIARELGVDLTAVTGSGPKGRITKEDLLAYMRGPAAPHPGAAAPCSAQGVLVGDAERCADAEVAGRVLQ